MLKWLLWILLAANALLFAAMQWGWMLTGGSKNSLRQPELSADKIVVLTGSPEVHSAVSLPATTVVPQVQPDTGSDCLEWGEFSGEDLRRSSSALAALNLGERLTQRQVEYASGYWAYIPPAKTRAEVDKKISVLKSYGVADYFVVQDPGKWHNAISLGVFKTREAADKFVNKLYKMGIKTPVVGERMSKLKFTVFVLKNPDAAVIEKIAALQKEYDGSELRSVACD